MITSAILILIVAKALPGLNTQFSSIHVTRITSIVFLFAGALSLNCLNLECIGSGIGLYSGLFQVTAISQLIEIFLFTIGGGILIAWPQIKYKLASLPAAQLTDALESLSTNYGAPLSTVRESDLESRESDLEARGCNGGREKLTTFVLLTDKHSTDYSLVVLFSSLGSSLLISSYDLISVYLSIELQSFGLYVLSTLYRNSESSTSAGLKYFLLGGLSSCIILLGTGIIYSYTGTTNLESLYILNSVIDYNQQYIIQGISLGLILIFIGFLFKIAAAPLHNWSPDVYDGTPTIVTTWLTIIPKISILFILLELQIKLGIVGGLKTIIINNSGFSYAAGAEQNINLLSALSWSSWDIFNSAAIFDRGTTGGGVASLEGEGEISLINNILKSLLLISATLSLIIGSLLGLAQVRIKRLLAYSTISHIGFILLALAVNTEQSIDSFIFYIIQYTITNLNIFLVILGLTYFINSAPMDCKLEGELEGEGEVEVFASIPPYSDRNGLATPAALRRGGLLRSYYKDITYISEFKGYFFRNPLLSLSLAISLFSMAGIPPLIGFFSKQLVLYSALQNGYYFISVVAIIVSVISCSYYLQIIKVIFTSSSESSPSNEVTASYLRKLSKAFEIKSSSYYTAAGPGAHQPIKFTNKIDIIAAQPITNTHSYLISTLTFSILFFFIKPSLILNSTQLLSLSLFYI
jgi:NADH-ubiquinone oxidoreductase chain 2